MLSWLTKTVAACWKPVQHYARMNKDVGDYSDDLLWYKDISQHSAGEFSVAVVQANSLLEDHSQVETGPHGTFVGVYDGHGGPETAQFICDHLFLHLQRFAREEGCMSEEVLRRAFYATEEGFLALVTRLWHTKPQIAAVGSCCLVGVIWGERLYIANVGDSRAVMGSLTRSNGQITAIQLTADHNASLEEVRQELKALHPDDSHIVVVRRGVWRVKGIIQGIARRLVGAALHEAAKKREMRYSDLKKVERGIRRHFHDDITVVVVFLDHEMIGNNSDIPPLSVRGGIDAVTAPSDFFVLNGFAANQE